MSGTSWLDWRGPEAPGGARSLENRAVVALLIIAVLQVPGILVSPWGGPPSWLLNVTSVIAAIGTTLLYLVEARGIQRRRAWAMLALRPLLVVVVVFGAVAVVVAAQAGFIKVPVDVALAIWAWLGSPDHRPAAEPDAAPVRRPGVRATALVVAVAALDAAIWYGPPVFGWGGLLDVHQADFTGALKVDCGPPMAGSPPATVAISYDWSWSARAAFSSGLDVVVIGWRGADGQGRTLYLLGDTPDTGRGIQPSLQDFPSLEMAKEIEGQMASPTSGSWHWGIHLDQQNLAPGHIQFTIELAHPNPPQPTPLSITASYIHLGLWHTDAPAVTCSW
jgi:hypothetical protein